MHPLLRKSLLSTVPELQSWYLNSRVTTAQPRYPRAKVVITCLTDAGPNANGKVTAPLFLPAFCDELRDSAYFTSFASSYRELEKLSSDDLPVFVIHLYGEDHAQILTPELLRLEKAAVAVFNGCEIGAILSDKMLSHEVFEKAGVSVPRLRDKGGFVRHRTGTKRATSRDEGAFDIASERFIATDFIDTRVRFGGSEYFTSVRVCCIDDMMLHAYPRARNAREGEASVHASDTPLEPSLIEFLDETLVRSRVEDLTQIAKKIYQALGHGFFAHDLLVERDSGLIFVCESGFKFDDRAYWSHLEQIASEIPSQQVLYPVQSFARLSARKFVTLCDTLTR